jgi:hypothetical protein
VFWLPGSEGGPVVLSGSAQLTPEQCQAVAERLLTKAPPERASVLWNAGPDRPAPRRKGPPRPTSAALVRVAKPGTPWIVALSFDPSRQFREADVQLIGLARRMLVTQVRQSRIQGSLKDSLVGVFRCLMATLDAKDPCTAGHSERVARIAILLGERMGLAGKALSDLFLAGLLHDVGKIAVPDAVLLKPGRLTPEEFTQIQEHTVTGDTILAGIPHLDHLRAAVRSHHERFDGTGYPDRLAGTTIPFLGRLIAVADACDAMMSARRYRTPLTPPQIDVVFTQGAGTQWDPVVVEQFMACRPLIYPPIYQKGIGESALHAIDRVVESVGDGSEICYRILGGPGVDPGPG